LFINSFLSLLVYPQKEAPKVINLSPNGFLENVFDSYGNRFSLSDIKIEPTKTSKTGTSLTTSPAVVAGYYNLYFETGSGMEDTNNSLHLLRRAVVVQVFKDLSNFINSPLTGSNRVNIWVRDINQLLGATQANPNPALTSSTAGLATAFNNMPNKTTLTFGGIIDNEVWKTIHAGVDSYTNVSSPVVSATTGIGTSGIFYHGMMGINFTNPAITWNTNMSAPTTTNSDLYTTVLHEVMHALGFASLISSTGGYKFSSGFNYYSRYDKFLKSSGNVNLITQSTTLSTMYNYQFNSSLNSSILHPAPSSPCSVHTVCNSAINFSGTSIVPVHTPNCFSNSSSLSHFEDECIAAPNQQYK